MASPPAPGVERALGRTGGMSNHLVPLGDEMSNEKRAPWLVRLYRG